MIKNEKKFYVYIYRDPRSKWTDLTIENKETFIPFYVGKGFGLRSHDHLKENAENTKNRIKHYKIQKILSVGLEPIIEKYKENLTEQEAYDLEENLIKSWGLNSESTSPLTNVINGGIGGKAGIPHSESHKQALGTNRLEKIKTGKIVYVKGKDHAFFGQTHTQETKDKISKANKGNKWTDEAKLNFSKVRTGKPTKPHTQETKDKIGNANRGRIKSEENRRKISQRQLGVPHSEETRTKIRNATQKVLSKTYEITFPNGHKEIITNLSEFCRNQNFSSSANMVSVASGKLKHYKGFACRRLDIL